MSNEINGASCRTEHQKTIDAILDEALDELDDSDIICRESSQRDLVDEAPVVSRKSAALESSPTQSTLASESKAEPALESPVQDSRRNNECVEIKKTRADEALDDMMKQLMSGNLDSSDDEATAMLSSFMKQLQTELQAEVGSDLVEHQADRDATKSSKVQATVAGPPLPPPKDEAVTNAIDSLLENLKQPAIDEPEMDEAAKMMEELTREFEKFMPSSGGDPSDALMDGMMQQLLSKELMYEPMKQVCEKFPVWLETNKDTLPAEEYDRRRKQLECFKQLVEVYEIQPENTEQLITLMERVQEYGQPPAEIIQELAPGLVFDDNGIPQGAPGEQDCTVM